MRARHRPARSRWRIEMTHRLIAVVACWGLLLSGAAARGASDKAPTKKDDLEQRVEQQSEEIRDLQKRIEELEEASPKTETPPPVSAPPAARTNPETARSAEEVEA